MKALGTLGSGNHFLELQRVSEIVDGETANLESFRESGCGNDSFWLAVPPSVQ